MSLGSIDFRSTLNPQQYDAVTAPDGKSLVIAGAGSGKTRTLIYRVAWLLEHGAPASSILLLTFTNKAAQEMMKRIQRLSEESILQLWGGTFHSIGGRILRTHAEVLSYKRDFIILDRSDSKDLIEACMRDAKIKPKTKEFPSANVLMEILSTSINHAEPTEETIRYRYPIFENKIETILGILEQYILRKKEQNKLDFDDLLTLPLQIFEKHPEILSQYQNRFRHILVDEYQDTNFLQNKFIELLASDGNDLMVVGDDAQSIYSWRGASFKNILEFPIRHPECHKFLIETNYRSTNTILDLANTSIQNNTEQFHKNLRAIRSDKEKPTLILTSDTYQEAEFIAQKAIELHNQGIPYHQMAVLYRAHHHALELQITLRKHQIPFTITSGIRFFEQAHIKDITSILRIACSPADEAAFKRIVLKLPAIGPAAADKLWRLFIGKEWPENLTCGLERCTSAVPKKSRPFWEKLTAMLKEIDPCFKQLSIPNIIQHLLDNGLKESILSEYENAQARLEDIQQLSIYCRNFETLPDFLSEMALQSNTDTQNNSTEDTLNLSTIHQAKGLEYHTVFLIMLCENFFPNTKGDTNLAEERRLFYVGITRAQNNLYLLSPRNRGVFDRNGPMLPSRFISELPKELFSIQDLTYPSYGYYHRNQYKSLIDSENEYSQIPSAQYDSPEDVHFLTPPKKSSRNTRKQNIDDDSGQFPF